MPSPEAARRASDPAGAPYHAQSRPRPLRVVTEELWVVWSDRDGVLDIGAEQFAVAPRLWLVRSDRTRSQIYHSVKRQLPEGAALFVAPLAGQPKAKGAAPGLRAFLGPDR